MNRKLLQLLLVSSLPTLLTACSGANESRQIQRLGHDFIVETLSNAEDFPTVEVDPDCDSHLAKILCVSDDKELGFDKNCSFEKVQPQQIAALQNFVKELPPFHQKVMCHLNRVQIQNNIYSIAYASGIAGPEYFRIGNMIGLRPEVLEKGSVTDDLFSWKEQLNFGLSQPNDPERKPSPLGPQVIDRVPPEFSQYLSVIIHELNHLVDYMNRANEINYADCVEDEHQPYLFVCQSGEKSFSRLSWGETTYTIMAPPEVPDEELNKLKIPGPAWHSTWPLAGKLCFYNCQETIPVEFMQATYAEVAKTNFVTPYSTQSSYEDFAEAATYYTLNKTGVEFEYKVLSATGQVYFDGFKQFQSDLFKSKRDWLSEFFAKDLVYQVQPRQPQKSE
ncbi:hypothetical protein [Bdellovibrio sp. HCB2-146]|uniref:hypothetical protein n=1 Tax=Bdellovibrio sp. HCB2-146 TaxID=3394362 RepID=UPI0039BC4FFB